MEKFENSKPFRNIKQRANFNSWNYLKPSQLQVEFISFLATDDLMCTILEFYKSFLF